MRTQRSRIRMSFVCPHGLGVLRTPSILAALAALAGLALPASAAGEDAGPQAPAARRAFTPLLPLPAPRIVRSSEEYPGGAYKASHLLDGNPRTEYSSNAKGLETFVELDFGGRVRVGAFRHADRNDPATVAASELVFLDGGGKSIATVPVAHADVRGGVTLAVLPAPVAASGVRWRVTRLGPRGYSTVGGAEIGFFQAGEPVPEPAGLSLSARLSPLVERRDGGLVQALRLDLGYPYAEPLKATVKVEGLEPREVDLAFGSGPVELALPFLETARTLRVSVEASGSFEAPGRPENVLLRDRIELKPSRRWEIHVLPHSHVDIGYTARQADVERKQNENIETGLRLARATKDYPEGSRFKWNVEVLWPVENYLRSAAPQDRDAFIAAVKSGDVGLDAFYGNVLTGLCRPEELIRLMSYAARLSALCGVSIESAMISDVPGYTWSTVSAMAHAGVRYFSFAPNYFDRMGGTMVTWQDRPFWWKGPDGKARVLCWCPSRGYALGHIIGDGEALARFLPGYLDELEAKGYPYDLTHLRWSVYGDNGSPDEKVADVVRDWNVRYAWPRLAISTTAATFRELERRHGDELPEFAGDYTPYWEDGAASSALETALNRASAERLVRAETLWALRGPAPFPADAFHEAWRNVLLYSEHTWGAHNSVSQPDEPFVLDQWNVKRAFALDADAQSRKLVELALPAAPRRDAAFQGDAAFRRDAVPPRDAAPQEDAVPQGDAVLPRDGALPAPVDVINTCSFPRSDLVAIPWAPGSGSLRVVDDAGSVVASQRLSTGELAFVARDVPGFGARRYTIEAGAPGRPAVGAKAQAKAGGNVLEHPEIEVRIDEKTGAIASFRSVKLGAELVDSKAAVALNDYLYLPGSDPKRAERSGSPRISVREAGPVVASLLIESEAPGCRRLAREVRVIDGLDRVDITNTVDKEAVREKEGVHFGYAFDVPDGTVRMDVGWAVVRPEEDQIPASCKNWFSVQRWVDISNARLGVTWATVDAPLVELGGLTANLLGSQTDHRVWIQKLEPTQTIYSWVMNNHWHTNYRAEQEGPVVFRYSMRPHGGYSPAAAARFGMAASRPLIAVPAEAGRPPLVPPLRLEAAEAGGGAEEAEGAEGAEKTEGVEGIGVIATALKPSDDGKAWILRLFGASGRDEKTSISWRDPRPARIFLSDTSERPIRPLAGDLVVPAWGIVTLRAEWPSAR